MEKFILLLLLYLPLCLHQKNENDQDGLEMFVRNSFYNFGEFLASGVYDLRIPSLDPLNARRIFHFETTTDSSSITGSIRQCRISGLSNMTISRVDMNIPQLNLNLSFTIRNLLISGLYSAEGVVYHILPVEGNGEFVLNVENVVATVLVKMKRDEAKNNLDVDEIEMNFSNQYLNQQFSNMMGGGQVGKLTNYLAKKLGADVFESLIPFLKKGFGEAIRRKLVQVLRKITVDADLNIRVKRNVHHDDDDDDTQVQVINEYFDQVIDNFRKIVKDRNLDPFPIPDLDSKIFKNGTLTGLGSIKQFADSNIVAKDSFMLIEVVFLLENVVCNYNWTLWFLPNHRGNIQLLVGSVVIRLRFGINLSNKNSEIGVHSVKIIDMKGIVFNMSGLETLNYAMSTLVNEIASEFKNSFFHIVETVVKHIIEFSVNSFIQTSN